MTSAAPKMVAIDRESTLIRHIYYLRDPAQNGSYIGDKVSGLLTGKLEPTA